MISRLILLMIISENFLLQIWHKCRRALWHELTGCLWSQAKDQSRCFSPSSGIHTLMMAKSQTNVWQEIRDKFNMFYIPKVKGHLHHVQQHMKCTKIRKTIRAIYGKMHVRKYTAVFFSCFALQISDFKLSFLLRSLTFFLHLPISVELMNRVRRMIRPHVKYLFNNLFF